MTFVKSLAAGIAAIIGYAVLVGLIEILAVWRQMRRQNGFSGGMFWPVWPQLVGALLVFVAAFVWAFTRVSKSPTVGNGDSLTP